VITEEKLAEERRRVKTVTECLLDKDVTLRDMQFEKRALLEEVETLNTKINELNRRIIMDEKQQSSLREERYAHQSLCPAVLLFPPSPSPTT